MAMWWVADGDRATTTNYVKVSELANCQCNNSVILNDIAIFLNGYVQRFNCPSEFVWKGMPLGGQYNNQSLNILEITALLY